MKRLCAGRLPLLRKVRTQHRRVLADILVWVGKTSAQRGLEDGPILFRALFRRELIRHQLHRFHAKIARIAGDPRQARPRGRPRKAGEESGVNGEQGHLEL